eukprot:196890_1
MMNKKKKKNSNTFKSPIQIYNRLKYDKTLNINLKNVYIGYKDLQDSQEISPTQEICMLDWKITTNKGKVEMNHILYFVLISNNTNNDKLIIWDRETKTDRLWCSGNTKK